jgi:hypothetical protein
MLNARVPRLGVHASGGKPLHAALSEVCQLCAHHLPLTWVLLFVGACMHACLRACVVAVIASRF